MYERQVVGSPELTGFSFPARHTVLGEVSAASGERCCVVRAISLRRPEFYCLTREVDEVLDATDKPLYASSS